MKTAAKILAIAGIGLVGLPQASLAEETAAQTCDASSLSSVPGKAWSEDYGWRYDTSTSEDPEQRTKENLEKRAAAYRDLVENTSPWPTWFTPSVSILMPGTLFQMAMGPKEEQPDNWPGGFGTFDDIRTVNEVRDDLAVIWKWKKKIDRVNVYRVKEVLPVHVGPIGPQVDPDSCRLLPGRFSQFEMLVPTKDRMHYIELVSSHPIAQDETK